MARTYVKYTRDRLGTHAFNLNAIWIIFPVNGYKFLNRTRERTKLIRALNSSEPSFIVVYGRRRCGKSTLLQHIAGEKDIYYLADQQEAPLQIKNLAAEVARHIPGFEQVSYPSWEVLFNAVQNQTQSGTTLIIDEFPYLVQKSPELPSILQKQIDSRKSTTHLIICGSSQRMMQRLVLDSTALGCRKITR